jgi:capsular polysaccharide biosynthesis protein
MNIIDLPIASRCALLQDEPAVLTPPAVLNRELIPAETLAFLERVWSQPPKQRAIEIYRLHDVFVAHEGLVFDRDLNLYRQTITQHEPIAQQNGLKAIQEALESKTIAREAGCFVLCKKRAARNYGHWLIEMMPMAKVARDHIKLAGARYIVSDEAGALGSVVEQSMNMIGVASSDLRRTSREPHWFEELIVVTGLTQHGIFMSPRVFEAIDAMTASVPYEQSGKIYASRRQMSYRKFVDEDEIETIMGGNGYRTRDTGAMKFSEQISLFKGADAVTGVMGAALTNIVFCGPGTKVVNLAPAKQAGSFFWLIAAQRGLDYTDVRCAQVGPKRGNAPWDTDLKIEPSVLDSLLSSPAQS